MHLNHFLDASLLLVLSLTLLQGCKQDPDYDLDNIDKEISVVKGLTLPLPNFKAITIGKIIDDELDGQNQTNLKTDAEGNYFLEFDLDRYPATGYDGVSLKSSELMVPQSFEEQAIKEDVTPPVYIPAGVQVAVAQEMLSTYYHVDDDFEISFDLSSFPKEVTSVKEAALQGELSYQLSSSMPFKHMILCSGALITFPDWLVIDHLTGDYAGFFDIKGHTLEAKTDVNFPAAGFTIGMVVSKFMIQDEKGLVLAENPSLVGSINLLADVTLNIAEYEHISGGMTTQAYTLDAIRLNNRYDATDLAVTSALVKIDQNELVPSFGGEQGYKISGIPDFLTDGSSDIALSNIDAHLFIENTTPCRFDLDGLFLTKKGDLVLWSSAITKQRIEAATAAGPTTTELTLTEQDLPGINVAICQDLDFFSIDQIHVSLVDDGFITLYPDVEYGASFSGYLEAPLSFVPGSNMTLTENVDLGLEIRKDDLVVPQITLNMTAVNTLPFELTLGGKAIGQDGNPLQSVRVSADKPVAASASTPVCLTLDMDVADIKMESLDLSFTIKAIDNAQINRNQGIELKNVFITLPQGITLDLNDKD